MRDLDKDGIQEKVWIYLDRDRAEEISYRAKLFVSSRNFVFSKYIGDGFSPSLTDISVLSIGRNAPPFIVVDSAQGAHSWLRSAYSFSDGHIVEVLKTYSDAPSIKERDVDHDKIKEIVVKMRDYDKDPIADSYEKIYKWNGEKFAEIKH